MGGVYGCNMVSELMGSSCGKNEHGWHGGPGGYEMHSGLRSGRHVRVLAKWSDDVSKASKANFMIWWMRLPDHGRPKR